MNAKNHSEVERELRDERARLATFIEGSQAGVWTWDIDTGDAEVNDRWAEMLGHTIDELAPINIDTWVSRLHPADRPQVREHLLQHYAGAADHHAFDARVRHADGSWVRVRAYGRISKRDVDGRPLAMHGLHLDVTSRTDVTDRLRCELAESRQLLQMTLDAVRDAVITTDANGIVRSLNPVAERMTGWPRAAAAGRPIAQVFVIVDEDTRMAAPDPVAACIDPRRIGHEPIRTLLLSRDGQEFSIEDTASPIRDEKGELLGAVLVFHDVSEQRRMTREMTHRATHDPLTGLANRAEFEVRLQRLALSLRDDAGNNALLYIDLDHFKLVNDACGHSVGDQLLIEVSAMMRRCVRSRDTVARLGGDEFAVILEHCDAQQAQRIAQKMCDELDDFRFTHDGHRFRVGASIGLVPFDRRWESVEAATQAADASCHAAKTAGRNRVHVWVDADAEVTARHGELQWVSRLEHALDENRFELYGQRIEPIGKHSTGLHCEVLLRLREPDGTIVPPGMFLPAAERFHLATRIDRWVIREVFARLDDRSNFANEVEMIAINLSGHSIGDRAFHRDVVKMIRAASFDVRKLCFEITETVAVTNLADAKLFIDEVRRMGVKIALDDFGAGASSFGYLKSLPVDFLKIDGSFITGLLDDALDDAAVRCFREVARVVGVQTIAEFVERDDVHDVLRAIGIDMAQGYLIHRPEPLSAMTAELV